ncbi:MAG: SRPBCC domain-containing protein [Opitutaceae bacterium]
MTPKKLSPAATTRREIVISRVFDAPRELVWQAWTDAAHLAKWWGPQGFTNPVCQWEPQAGKSLHVVMRGPNGTDYPMGGEFLEVVRPERLVFTSGALDEKGQRLFEFHHVVLFAEQSGQTKLTIKSRLTKTTPGADQYTDGFKAGMTQSLEKLADLVVNTADREIVVSRVFDAPRALVWQAWTDPQHVVKWWGPRGFSNTLKKMDFRVGGYWEHTMHGPDGTNYPNKALFKEIVPQERIVMRLGGGKEKGPGINFTATWTFETVENGQTRLTSCMVFPTAAMRDLVAKEFGAVEGGQQTLERLSEHLPTMQMREFTLTREFDAPRQLVWDAWTQAENLQRWFGPKGFALSVRAFNFKLGGTFLYAMKSPDGHEMWGKWTFREIVPPSKLVVAMSFSDPKGGLTRHPLNATWPLETLSTTTLVEIAGQTTLTLRTVAINATAKEIKTFEAGHDSMDKGWGGTIDQLTTYLTQVAKGGRTRPGSPEPAC